VKEHVVTQSLAPAFLVSMPQMLDPNFARTVVLLCRHNEDGAFGLVVNRPMLTSGRVIVNLDPPISTEQELQVWIGGPVEPERSWMLVGEEPAEDDETAGLRVASGLYLSTSPELLRRSLEPIPPPRTRLVVGYSDGDLVSWNRN
jgi:putative transcriptional regulator